MPDWKRIVEERLALPALSGGPGDTIVEELAAQLEDVYQEVLESGAGEDEALSMALGHVEDWDQLRAELIGTIGRDLAEDLDVWFERREIRLRRMTGRIRWLADILRDVRFAIRRLRLRPGFTLLTTLSIALGLGAATAVFSVTNALLFRPLPIEEPERVVEVYNGEFGNHPYPTYLAMREAAAPFLDLAARDEFWFGELSDKPVFLRAGTQRMRVDLALASDNYFSMLGLRPAAGRFFLPTDDEPAGGASVAVLSWAFWQTAFEGAAGIVGQTIDLSGIDYTVVGIAPEGFRGTDYSSDCDLWIPTVMRRAIEPPESELDLVAAPDWSWIRITGRMKPGVSLGQAQARLEAIVANADWAQGSLKERGPNLQPIRKATILAPLRDRIVRYMSLLMVAVGLVIAVVCVNLTGLFTGQMEERSSELAVRRALGAGNRQIARQFLAESAVVVSLGGLGALLIAIWMDRIVLELLSRGFNVSQAVAETAPDLRVLGFALGIVLVLSAVLGLAPMWQSRPGRLSAGMRAGRGTSSSDRRLFSLRNILAMGQLAISAILLAGAGLMLQSLVAMKVQDVGLNTSNTYMLTLDNERIDLRDGSGPRLYERILERVRAVPGVTDVSLAKVAPLSGITWGGSMEFEGYEAGPDERTHASENYVDPGFFDMMGIRLLGGRGFDEGDVAGSENVVIVNQALVDRYWPDVDPLGRTIHWKYDPDETATFRVVGVVANHFYASMRSGVPPLTYYPIGQQFLKNPTLLVRTSTEPTPWVPGIRRAVLEVEPLLNFFDGTSLDSQIREAGGRERSTLILLSSFAALTLMLALLGTYGAVSALVRRRWQEIGIRLALGARPGELLSSIVATGMRMVMVGLGTGVVLSFGTTQIARRLVFVVTSADAYVYLAVAFMLGLTGAIACIIPARRVLQLNPIETLRTE